MERFALYNNYFYKVENMAIVPTGKIDAIFKRALPQNDVETANMINSLAGLVDKETLVSQLSFVNDAKEIVAAAEKEEEESLKLGAYGTFNTETTENPDEEEQPAENAE